MSKISFIIITVLFGSFIQTPSCSAAALPVWLEKIRCWIKWNQAEKPYHYKIEAGTAYPTDLAHAELVRFAAQWVPEAEASLYARAMERSGSIPAYGRGGAAAALKLSRSFEAPEFQAEAERILSWCDELLQSPELKKANPSELSETLSELGTLRSRFKSLTYPETIELAFVYEKLFLLKRDYKISNKIYLDKKLISEISAQFPYGILLPTTRNLTPIEINKALALGIHYMGLLPPSGKGSIVEVDGIIYNPGTFPAHDLVHITSSLNAAKKAYIGELPHSLNVIRASDAPTLPLSNSMRGRARLYLEFQAWKKSYPLQDQNLLELLWYYLSHESTQQNPMDPFAINRMNPKKDWPSAHEVMNRFTQYVHDPKKLGAYVPKNKNFKASQARSLYLDLKKYLIDHSLELQIELLADLPSS